MPFRDLGFNFTYYYFINSLVCVSQNLFCLIDDAKVQRLLPDSKNLGEIFPELLRHALILATKPTHAINLCRKHLPKSPPKFVYAEKKMYLCSKLDNIWIARMKKH